MNAAAADNKQVTVTLMRRAEMVVTRPRGAALRPAALTASETLRK